ncbi:hypothetical protein NPIL_52161 [Nephila pilipes]|uniref:Uncharacterized protein n=1 Tax=Nephila pilipes TaxID=299642 RepID=A0A8X6NSQ9_NEPPI|nr:hypothetical protein NPIL_52161 [Nephila pilipes]
MTGLEWPKHPYFESVCGGSRTKKKMDVPCDSRLGGKERRGWNRSESPQQVRIELLNIWIVFCIRLNTETGTQFLERRTIFDEGTAS